MPKLLLMILMVLLSMMTDAKLYANNQINRLIDDDIVEDNKAFNRGFFVSKDPKTFIDKYISIHKNRIEPLFIESRLLSLLNEVSYQPKQPYLQVFINQMKHYQVRAFKMHDEGRVPVPIYNINARAKGIENIWLASESLNKYTRSFNQDASSTLITLKSTLNNMPSPEWLGLKNSIGSINNHSHILISDYLLENYENLRGLDKFVSRYALLTGNKNLVKVGLKKFNKSSSEYLLRSLKNYFEEGFVTKQLIAMVEINKNQSFAISMMLPYLTNKKIKSKLFGYLGNNKYSNQAALVLAQTKEESVLIDMQQLFNGASSEQTRKHIVFALKMNKLALSEDILKRLVIQLDEKSESMIWLNSFKGERK